jgi:hypothetical protein
MKVNEIPPYQCRWEKRDSYALGLPRGSKETKLREKKWRVSAGRRDFNVFSRLKENFRSLNAIWG